MNRTIAYMLVSLAIAVPSLPVFGTDSHDEKHPATEHMHGSSDGHMHDSNPLIEEMMTLDGVFRDVVSAVAVSDSSRVHEALERMHGTMEKTHEGVRHGTVKLRKNADRMNDFVQQDKQFHARLEKLAEAAQRNDGDAMLSLTKDLLDRCVKCHRDFRQP